MRVQYKGQLLIAEMASAFPYQGQPPFSHTDYMVNMTPNVVGDTSGFKIEPLLGCAFAQTLFVPHNQVNDTGMGLDDPPVTIVDDTTYERAGLPSVSWHNITLAGPYAIQAFAYRPWSFQYFDILCTDETLAATMSVSASANLTTPGLVAILNRNHFHFVDPSETTPAQWEFQWTIGDTLYSIVGGASQFASLRTSTDAGAHWRVVNGKLKTSGNLLTAIGNSHPESHSDTLVIEMLALNGKLSISLGGQQPFVLALPDNAAYPEITSCTVNCNYFTQFSWHVHPTKFATEPVLDGPPTQLGFVPDETTPCSYIVNTVQGATNLADGDSFTENSATIAIATNPDLVGTALNQYEISLSNPVAGTYNGVDYADKTAALVRVTTRVRGLSIGFPYVPRLVIPKQIVETVSFDLNSLCVRHNLEVTLSNWQGIDYWATVLGLPTFGSGNVAVALRLGWNHFPNGPDGGDGFARFFGFCNRFRYDRPTSNMALLTLFCTDQMQQLADSLVAAPPDLDGANHFCAMAWLALKAGITAPQIAWADLVPTLSGSTLAFDPNGEIDFYAPSPGIPDELQFFLPFGVGMHPWTPVNRTLSILEMMEFVRKVTGFLLFVDAYGFLRYEPWIPPNPWTAPKRIYTETPTDAYGYPGGGLTEMWDVTTEVGTENVRNQVILIGIDSYSPDWQPIVEKREDTASIRGYPGIPTPRNFVGYPKPFVWMDSRFGNSAFASASADQIAAILALPDYTIRLKTWMQPDIYPMDVVWCMDSRSNSGSIPFYVMQTRTVMSSMGRQIELSTELVGKFLIDPSTFL